MAPFPNGDPVHRVVLVERYLSGVTPQRLARLAIDTRATVAALTAEGAGVAYLGSIAISQEETCFCLFAADSPAVIEQVNRRIVIPYVRVVDALTTGPFPVSGKQ